MGSRMLESRKWRLTHFIGTAAIGAAALTGCKRLGDPAPAPAPTPPAVQKSATDIAPASFQYSAGTPVPAPAPVPTPIAPPATTVPALLSPKIWASVALADGRVFERVRVSAEDGATVTLMHARGIAKVDKRALPAELAEIHPYDASAAQFEAQQTAARRQADAAAKIAASRASVISPARPHHPAPASANQPATVSTAAIEQAVKTRARRYFETEKRLGSGQTLAFHVLTDLSEPREVSGWANRWEVTGTAGYKVYESVGWGSFSRRSTKFSAIVEAPPGKPIVVVSFDERS